MGRINWGRVVLGGLLAGVVLNVIDWLVYGVWLRADLAAALQALGKQTSAMDAGLPLWVALDFVYGIGLLWVYAAIRPRFGAGPKTAALAGVAVWFFVGLLHAISEAPLGYVPTRVATMITIATLIAYPVASAVGAYLYKEM